MNGHVGFLNQIKTTQRVENFECIVGGRIHDRSFGKTRVSTYRFIHISRNSTFSDYHDFDAKQLFGDLSYTIEKKFKKRSFLASLNLQKTQRKKENQSRSGSKDPLTLESYRLKLNLKKSNLYSRGKVTSIMEVKSKLKTFSAFSSFLSSSTKQLTNHL